MINIIILIALATAALGRQGFGPTEQEWGYVTVRENAHMFWWLHQTSRDVANYTERPLVVWLQGGPGSSSTGYGNFAELGPLDADLNPRDTTWINDYNVLFVDNPVGSGFSYVETSSAYVTTNRQIADDFLVLLKGFYEAVPELKNTPLYIFCESYGGKMTAEIALVVDQAIKNGELDVNLIGIGLGDSWISPVDSVLTWGPYLLNVGVVDQSGYEQIQDMAEATKAAFDRGSYVESTNLWSITEGIISQLTAGVDFYNILKKIPGYEAKSNQRKIIKPSLRDEEDDKIDVIMNTQVKEALGLNFTWGSQSGQVFAALSEDFMKPVTEIVELLLNTTDIQVGVYNGQLDLIVDTPGTVAWLNKLSFIGKDEYVKARRRPIVEDNIVEGYYKKGGHLAMYWIDRAGHMVPADNPAGMKFILSDIIDEVSK